MCWWDVKPYSINQSTALTTWFRCRCCKDCWGGQEYIWRATYSLWCMIIFVLYRSSLLLWTDMFCVTVGAIYWTCFCIVLFFFYIKFARAKVAANRRLYGQIWWEWKSCDRKWRKWDFSWNSSANENVPKEKWSVFSLLSSVCVCAVGGFMLELNIYSFIFIYRQDLCSF